MSWIGKAHCVGKMLTARSVCPAEYSGRSCTDDRCDEAENRWHRWLIVDGPPASCAQLGMFHAGVDTADFDAIISGPNWGRNAGRVYNLSSGTVGGALEGALGGIKAVALSFATKDTQPDDIISEACAKSVEVIGNLSLKWHPEVDLYNVNIPMVEQLASRQVKYTTPMRTFWAGDSLFKPVEKSCEEEKLSRVYQFRWAPELKAHKQQSLQSPEGEDLWASLNGFIGVTPMKANFEVVPIIE
jgi:5'/3'-nucleotidase SurE